MPEINTKGKRFSTLEEEDHQMKKQPKKSGQKSLCNEAAKELLSLIERPHPNYYKAGELLLAVKKELPHGEFIRWVSGNCSFSPRTALNFMKLYQLTHTHPELIGLRESTLYLLGTKRPI